MNTVTINVSLPKELLKKVDRLAKQESRTRSELLRESLRRYLLEMTEWEDIFAYGEKRVKALGIKSEEDVYRIVEELREEESANKKN